MSHDKAWHWLALRKSGNLDLLFELYLNSQFTYLHDFSHLDTSTPLLYWVNISNNIVNRWHHDARSYMTYSILAFIEYQIRARVAETWETTKTLCAKTLWTQLPWKIESRNLIGTHARHIQGFSTILKDIRHHILTYRTFELIVKSHTFSAQCQWMPIIFSMPVKASECQ